MMRVNLAAAALLVFTSAASAGEMRIPGVIGEDNRTLVDSVDPPWNAVGKLQAAGYNWVDTCTATLIAPDAIVTAAHCLFDQRRKKPIAATAFNFLAGMRRDTWLAHGKIKCAKLPPSFNADAVARRDSTNDVAIMMLEGPIAIRPLQLASAIAIGSGVSHAGYGMNRRFLLSVHTGCHITAVREGLAATDCDTTHGQSGGPVLIREAGELRIAGIMSGYTRGGASIAVTVEAWRGLLMESRCEVNPLLGQ